MSDPDSLLYALPSLKETVEAYDLWPKKSMGQNFLFDLNITDKIARAAGDFDQGQGKDLSQAHVLEIGPGPGGLTRSLLKAGAKSVSAIEFDPRAVEALQELKSVSDSRLNVIQADALGFDYTELENRPVRIVANLPYNIATPLLVTWLRMIREQPDMIESMTLMFQKEVGQRITAKTGEKHYGRLGVLSQWLCDVRKCFDLSPKAFYPPPKITSSIVHFTPKKQDGVQPAAAFDAVEKVTEAAFGQRRKMIRTSLKAYAPVLENLDIDQNLRAEQLSVDQYIAIAKGEA